MVQGYGGVALWGLSSITSILAWNGIAVEFNIIVWYYFMIVLGSIVAISGFVLKFLAFDSAYKDMYDLDGVAPIASAAFTNIMLDFAIQNTMLASAALIFYFYWDHWKYAMWMAIGEEAQQEQIDELYAEIAAEERDMGYNPYATPAPEEKEEVEEEKTAEEETTPEGVPSEQQAVPEEWLTDWFYSARATLNEET